VGTYNPQVKIAPEFKKCKREIKKLATIYNALDSTATDTRLGSLQGYQIL
jgi:hypothetical protein